MNKLKYSLSSLILSVIVSVSAESAVDRAFDSGLAGVFMSKQESVIRQTDPPTFRARSIAEFEPMSGVLIRYPLGIPLSLVALLSESVEVVTIVENQYLQNQALAAYINSGVNIENCSFMTAPTNSYWTRDYGPWFIFDGDNEFGVMDFNYNTSLGYPRPLDNQIPLVFADFFEIDYYHLGIDHVGGNYMSDGMGIAASTHMAYTENPDLTPSEVDQIMYDYLGIGVYHVLDDPTNCWLNHIDTWSKFLAVDKILIRSVPPHHPQYSEIELVADYFASTNSSYGLPFRVYRVYTPNNEPYTNSLILNDNVYVPVTGSTWDGAAVQTYQEAMPGYNVHPVYSNNWLSIDALHCRTKEIADSEMLHVSHYPLLGLQDYQDEYLIQAGIYPHSGQPLIDGSAVVRFSINGGVYDEAALIEVSPHEFEAVLINIAPGDTVSYYLKASDHSGRTEKHPYIGSPDPHIFYLAPPEMELEFEFDYHSIIYYHEFPLNLQIYVYSNYDIFQSVLLQFKINDGAVEYLFLQNCLENNSLWSIVFDPEISTGDLITYRFALLDNNSPPNFYHYPEDGWFESAVEMKKLVKPYFVPEPGNYSEAVNLKIISEEEDVSIFYTLDGSYPDHEAELFTQPLLLNETTVITAVAYKESFLESEAVVGEYIITTNTSLPDISVPVSLMSVYPNPFNPVINFSFIVNEPRFVTIRIYNLKGQMVHLVSNDFYSTGTHQVSWDSHNNNALSSGIYFYLFETEDLKISDKIILIK